MSQNTAASEGLQMSLEERSTKLGSHLDAAVRLQAESFKECRALQKLTGDKLNYVLDNVAELAIGWDSDSTVPESLVKALLNPPDGMQLGTEISSMPLDKKRIRVKAHLERAAQLQFRSWQEAFAAEALNDDGVLSVVRALASEYESSSARRGPWEICISDRIM